MKEIMLQGDDGDPSRVWGVMLFPSDPQLWNQYAAWRRLETDTAAGQTVLVDKQTLELLKKGVPSEKDLEQTIVDRTRKATVAGLVLSAIYVMDKFSIPEPSINKAIDFARYYAMKAKQYGDGSKMNRSRRIIREHWDEFKPVAHLWAAKELNRDYPFAPEREVLSPEYFGTFLGVAKGLLEFGVSFIPFRARPSVPILDRELLWQIPEAIPIRNLKSDCQSIRMTKFFKSYRA